MHNRKYRLRYDQSVTCLFHSVKFFALTSSQLYSSHSEKIYRKRRNSNKQSHHNDKTKAQQTNTKVLATKQKQKGLTRLTCRCARKWSVERELERVKRQKIIGKGLWLWTFLNSRWISCPHEWCVNLIDNMSQMIRYATRITWNGILQHRS